MSPKQAPPVPILNTERLILRGLYEDDKKFLFLMRSDPEVNRFIERKLATSMADIEEHLHKVEIGAVEGGNLYWIIQKKANPELLGTICLWNFSEDRKVVELGYSMRIEFQRKGIMDEALKAVLEYGFETLKLEKIEAFTQFENLASIHLLEKNNFELEPERRDKGFPKNRIYSLSKNSEEI